MFKTAATKLAHNSTIPALAGNRDIRPLQDLITAEKAVIVSLQKLSVDFSKSSEALRAWGMGEGEDLGNILTASTSILTHFSSALSQYSAHGHTMREHLKSIRSREEGLEELKRRRRGVMSKADAAEKKLSKMSPEHKNLPQQSDLLNRLREEIRGLDVEIMREEAALGDFKRSVTRTWVGLKFGGLLEFCEKGAIAGEYGKLVVSEISEEITEPGLPRAPYHAHNQVETYVAEAHRCVNEVRLSTVPSNSSPNTRRAEHQLPQVHSMNDSPFMGQGPFSGQHSLDSYYDNSQGYEQQNIGNSRLYDSFDPTTSAFSSPQHQPQYSGSLSSASAMQPGMRRIDEFGSPTGPVDNSVATGGRFATFPVRQNRSGSMDIANTNTNNQLPSLVPVVTPEQEGSFSSSVAQALSGSSQTNTQDIPPLATRTAQPGRLSKDGPAPAYESDVGHTSNPWTNQQQLSPNNQTEPTHTRPLSNLSEDDALLSYVTTSHDDPQDASGLGHVGGGEVDDRHASRHVRFGDVRDIDNSTTSAISVSPQVSTPGEQSYTQARRSMSMEEQVPLSPSDQLRHMLDGTQPDSPTSANRAGRPNRVPVPMSLDDERALDAAAARGIVLEMSGGGRPSISNDGTSTTSLPPVIIEPETTSQSESLLYNNNGSHPQIQIPRGNADASSPPLAPPSAAFMGGRRSVSPRPESGFGTGYNDGNGTGFATGGITSSPLTSHHEPSYTHQQQQAPNPPYSQDRFDHSPISNQPPQPEETYATEPNSYANEYNPYEETHRSQQAPPQINLPELQSSSLITQYGSYPFQQQQVSTPGSELYQTPPEQITPSLNLNSGTGIGTSPLTSAVVPSSSQSQSQSQSQSPYLKSPNTGRSTSPLKINSGGGAGGAGGTGKKISAAAFKRPSPRLGSGNSPFSIPSPTSTSQSEAGSNKKLPSPYGDSGTGTGTGKKLEEEDGDYDLPPYQPLAQSQSQSQSRRRDTSDFDGSQYDYISAYVNSGDEQQRSGGGSGTGQGLPPGPGGYYYDQGQGQGQGQGGYYGQGQGQGQGGHGDGRFNGLR